MKLSETNGPDAPAAARKFWEEVEKTPPSAWCEDCDLDAKQTCEACKHDNARSLINAERFA